MRRRVFALIFLLDLLSLAAGMVVASLVALETPLPWLAPAGLVRGSVFPLLGSLFTGLAIGSYISMRSFGHGVPRPSYGRAVTIATTTLSVTALAIVFLRSENFYFSRLFIGVSIATMFLLGLSHRAYSRSRPWTEPMVLISGEKELMDAITESPHANVMATFDPLSPDGPGPMSAGVSLVVDLRALLSEQMAQFVSSSSLAGYPIRSLVSVYEEHTGRMAIVHLAEGWELRTPVESRQGLYPALKRLVDIGLTAVTAPIWVPLALVVAAAVKLSSGGPVIFRQPRVGQGGRVFTINKFRTMAADAEKDGPQLATEDDMRITRIGRYLRKYRLDELPQLWNVLKGDLSLVGPRPEQPVFVEQFIGSIPFYNDRHLIRPGITGWAQVNYGYADNEADTIEKLTYDLYYVKNASPWLDIHIFGKSIWTVLSGFGAQ
jgi:lipopolysaccharide/colanic/teichoic acid biosynthesis glycosyltransferase